MSCRSSVDRPGVQEVMGSILIKDSDFFFVPCSLFAIYNSVSNENQQKKKTTIEQFLCFNVEDYTVHVKILALLRRISISRTFFTFSRVVFGQPIHNFKHFFSGFVCRQEAYGNNKRTVLFTCEKTKFLAIQA